MNLISYNGDMINIDLILSCIAALGGFEFIKWAYDKWAYKEYNKTIKDSEADSSEFSVLRDTNQYLQKALKEKEERFVDQTKRLRAAQDELFEEQKKNAALEVKLENAELWRCNIKMCGKREPPNGM